MKLEKAYRVVTFVPSGYVDVFLTDMQKINPLTYGNYSGVSWTSSPGHERFTPLQGASPTHGEVGIPSKTDSVRVEFSLPFMSQARLIRIIEDIGATHPWEEPVILVQQIIQSRSH